MGSGNTDAEAHEGFPATSSDSRAPGGLPEFFIVGNPKSGTTAIYEMLRSHPQIFMPELKETRFFDRELHPGLGPGDPHPQTVEQYLALFAPAGAGQRKGEASPEYLRSHTAAARILELQPRARIIAIFREPVAYMRAMHLELLKDYVETEKDLRRAMERDLQQRESKPMLWYGIDRVEYTAQLRRYHEAFGHDRVLVLIYDDFRADNAGTLGRILRFLEVEDGYAIGHSEANQSVLVRSTRAHELLRSIYLGRGPAGRLLSPAIKAVTSQRLRRGAIGVVRRRLIFGRPPAPDERLMRELHERYRPFVLELSEYLGRDLATLWGYGP